MNERIREIDKIGAEFARIAAEHEQASRLRRGRLRLVPRGAVAVAATVAALLTAGAFSVPVTRGAIADIADSFAGWVAGDDDNEAPGRPVRPEDDAPDWVRERGGRLIAKTDGVGLYVTRTETESGTRLSFALDSGIEVSDTIDGWRERFADEAVFVLGPAFVKGSDQGARIPVLGVTARSVERVELHYESGPPLEAGDIEGGFVLMADAQRPLQEIVAYDSEGNELGRADASHIDG